MTSTEKHFSTKQKLASKQVDILEYLGVLKLEVSSFHIRLVHAEYWTMIGFKIVVMLPILFVGTHI